ncbi:glycine cleavage system aminomethyltransferase GcvT [Candidatus Venteria ishoeyi]|uniref:glycine cleavage system aminomethyltransferase GcvT n=1 Tax=Candidatus Venteria ishoeyi TaxID=1899563 RepID=UPI0025A51960|nr:glycine cleavage system aminomethyltransferase GcvT [Candidatus Venteria ishoeyi]MDM8546138.1 glycine cleavage system aminomethyltransferase GcvT [Candidatus Venteria ishoeyi]
MSNKTALYAQHVAAGGKMVDFAGWEMPLHYGSQLNEHHQVRRDAGVFDVSHMTVVDITGSQAQDFLRYLLANDVARLKTRGKALYSCMLNTHGGVIDDLIVYFVAEDFYRMVVNAATREKDLNWIQQQSQSFEVSVSERDDLAMLAIQGPNARQKTQSLLPPGLSQAVADLAVFQATWEDAVAQSHGENPGWFIGRTGYTGEDGLEIMLPQAQAPAFWERLLAAEITPIGLGARDTLRLEAGMNLYGTDMTEATTPAQSGLSWTLMWNENRDFIGRDAILPEKERSEQVLVGLILQGKGIPRGHQSVLIGDPQQPSAHGEITSGTYSPTMKQGIALARIPAKHGAQVWVNIRNRNIPATVVKPPFVRHGKILHSS